MARTESPVWVSWYRWRVRLLECLTVITFVACSNKQPAPKQEAPAPAKGSADPWQAADGSSMPPEPKWAKDPPAVLRDKINGVNAHIIVLKAVASFAEYRDVLKLVEGMPGVVAAESFIFTEHEITAGKVTVNLALKGVEPARVNKVLTIGRHMKSGSIDALAKGEPPPIILGDDLAKQLAVKIGDDVTVSALKDAPNPTKPTVFRVAGTFHMDFDEYDERLAIAPLAAVQAMLGRGDQVMGIEAIVKDVDQSDEIAAEIEKKLGGRPYEVQDWYELNKPLFTALFGDRRP